MEKSSSPKERDHMRNGIWGVQVLARGILAAMLFAMVLAASGCVMIPV
jgi:hypothetical protein